MNTYPTLEAAIDAPSTGVTPRSIIEIDHATDGRCFIRLTCTPDYFRAALQAKPMPEILGIIAEHKIPAKPLPTYQDKCERCRVAVDPAKAYKQTERTRIGGSVIPVTAYYCPKCAAILKATGAMADRATDIPSYEPTHKED